jgi:hypothetical protein
MMQGNEILAIASVVILAIVIYLNIKVTNSY